MSDHDDRRPVPPAPLLGAGGGSLERASRAIEGLLRWLLILLMAAMSVVVLLQVAFRYLLSTPLPWSEEAARFLFVWVTFVGAALLVREDGHIKVTGFLEALPRRARALCLLVGRLVAIACVLLFLEGGLSVMQVEWDQLAPATELSMGLVYAVIPASSALMLAWLALGVLRQLGALVAKRGR